ncbi:MAG: STAS domain-containing protein [Planctomycetota bacterium]
MSASDEFPGLECQTSEKGVLAIRITEDRFELDQAQSVSRLIFESTQGVAPRILLNFAGVRYINSTGVSLLVRLRVVNVNPAVRKVMDSIGILPLLNIHRTEQEALDAF